MVKLSSNFNDWRAPCRKISYEENKSNITFTPPLVLPYSSRSIAEFRKADRSKYYGDPNVVGDVDSGGGSFRVKEIADIITQTLQRALPEYVSREIYPLRCLSSKNYSDLPAVWYAYDAADELKLEYGNKEKTARLEVRVHSPEKFFPVPRKRKGREPTITDITLEGTMMLPLYLSTGDARKSWQSLPNSAILAATYMLQVLMHEKPISDNYLRAPKNAVEKWGDKHFGISLPVRNPTIEGMSEALRIMPEIATFIQEHGTELRKVYSPLKEVANTQRVGRELLRNYDDSIRDFLALVRFVGRGNDIPTGKVLEKELHKAAAARLQEVNAALQELQPHFPAKVKEYAKRERIVF